MTHDNDLSNQRGEDTLGRMRKGLGKEKKTEGMERGRLEGEEAGGMKDLKGDEIRKGEEGRKEIRNGG